MLFEIWYIYIVLRNNYSKKTTSSSSTLNKVQIVEDEYKRDGNKIFFMNDVNHW